MEDNKHYIKFRCDLEEDEPVYPVIYRLFKDKLPTGVLGVETKNAYGETIKRHLHFHFSTEEKPETIRKRFIRTYGGEDKKPNYSLKNENDVKDTHRFHRYVLKQYEPDKFRYQYGDKIPVPTGFDLVMENRLAYEEWLKGTQILTKNAVKRDSRLTTYEKIIEELETNDVQFQSVREIQYYILDYYMTHKIPPQKSKILDMANGIAIMKHIISYDDFFSK